MKRSFGSLRVIIPVLLVVPFAYRGASWFVRATPQTHYDAELATAGRDLFVHEWTPNDPLAGGGDGLGPVFNAKSCSQCHKQGGLGGGGPLENNVTTFTQIDNPVEDARDAANRALRNTRNRQAAPAASSGTSKGSRRESSISSPRTSNLSKRCSCWLRRSRTRARRPRSAIYCRRCSEIARRPPTSASSLGWTSRNATRRPCSGPI